MTCFKKKANYTAQRFVVIINYSLMRSRIHLSECKMLAGISKIQYIPLPDSNTQANAKKHKQTNWTSWNKGTLKKAGGKKCLRINITYLDIHKQKRTRMLIQLIIFIFILHYFIFINKPLWLKSMRYLYRIMLTRVLIIIISKSGINNYTHEHLNSHQWFPNLSPGPPKVGTESSLSYFQNLKIA